MNIDRSRQLYEEARKYLPGGVDSPVRAFRAVGGQPIFVERGAGSRIYDADGNEYIDFLCSWGPLILGHAHPRIVEALKSAVEKGTSFGTPTELEVTLARMVNEAFPSIEVVRFVNSGTEATMSALRLARAFTRRGKVMKFDGCYHGHADSFLVKAGSGVLTLGAPDSPGIPPSVAEHTISLPYNDIRAVERAFEATGKEISAVIIEPVAGNMGVVPPKPGFLEGLRRISTTYGAILIFDEVITGFRVSYGGAQALYGIEPDLTCLGKIIGGGLPVGCYGGRRDIMELVAPEGPVYQAGTLSGNPLAMTAGIETLMTLREPEVYDELERKAARLEQGLVGAAREARVPVRLNRIGSMFTLFFTDQDVLDYRSAKSADTQTYAAFFHRMLERGVYLPPSQFEASFLSLAHSDADIEVLLATARQALQGL